MIKRRKNHGTIEVVRTVAGWHVRIKGRNGKTIVSSEVYKRKRTAQEAILVIAEVIGDVATETKYPDERAKK